MLPGDRSEITKKEADSPPPLSRESWLCLSLALVSLF